MPERGEIWVADLNPRRGTEPGKTRRLVRGPLARLGPREMAQVGQALLEVLALA